MGIKRKFRDEEYDYESDSSSVCSSVSSSSSKSSNVEVSAWQEGFVLDHLSMGHSGFCFAWLDTGICPLMNICGMCPYKHTYPETWNNERRGRHSKLVSFVKLLFDGDHVPFKADEVMSIIVNKGFGQ